MKSDLPKVLHPIAGLPMVGWVVRAAKAAATALDQKASIILVTGHQAEKVEQYFANQDLLFARQDQPLGTGHALACALPFLPEAGPVLVLAGDTPLIQGQSLVRLVQHSEGKDVTVASVEVPDPTGYGRIVRTKKGVQIVEEAHASLEEKAIQEVNSGAYVFESAYLRQMLPKLKPHPPKNELYATDLIHPTANVIGGFKAQDWFGVNDRAALAEARAVLFRRIQENWARAGVDFDSLDHAQVDLQVELLPGAKIGFGAKLIGMCRIAGEVGPYCVLKDTVIEAGGKIKAGSVAEGAVVWGEVGPMAHLRPGAVLEKHAKVGNFVEVKNAVLREGAKASHLSYLGDAEIGSNANVGAGTITCNYDGFGKNRTVIGPEAFIGSNTALVAPVEIGAGAIVGAGTTVTENVPEDSIAVGRPALKINEKMAPLLRARLKARYSKGKA
jgi:bifunctional UDP-N-acetylglucosamine pyrophosphorylase/glucosamine-1-phosphate N-acetyltransferase